MRGAGQFEHFNVNILT